jgi:large repetitive protein
MLNNVPCPCSRSVFAVRLSILLSLSVCLLLIAPRLSAQVTSSPNGEIFAAPGATQAFTLTVASGTTLGSVSVLTLGAPNLDFVSVASGTTCPTLTAGKCTVEVLFQPTVPGRRQGMIAAYDPSGNVLLVVSLDGAGSGPMTAFGPAIISTFAGGGTGGVGGPATSAQLLGPTGITVDGFGNHYIADPKANKVFEVNAAGVISTVAGTGTAGFSGDGGPATSAQLNGPMAVIIDGAGFIYIADTNNNVVRMVDNHGNISTYAGQFYPAGGTPPAVCAAATNSVGDGCPGNQMVMNTPVDIVFCHAQNLHIADKLNNRVRTIVRTSYNTITQVGNGVAGYNGDTSTTGVMSTTAELNGPTGMDMDAANYIYVSDAGNHTVRKTLLSGTTPEVISTLVGTPGSAGNSGDGGLATSALLDTPAGLKVDPAGDLYISDTTSQVIRKFNIADGKISTIVGTATAGNTGNGGPASAAQLNSPIGVLLDDNGNLYIADSQNLVVRKVDVADAPSVTFPNTTMGATSPAQDVTVMNLGDAPLTITAISSTGNYSLGGSDTSCSLTGVSLNPATSCVLGIEFIPTTGGTASGSVVLADNANPASQTIALTGTSALPTEAYTLTVTTSAVSMAPGGTVPATLTLNSSNYAGTVSFALAVTSTDGTAANVTASATPVTLTSGGTGTSTVTITATASAANHSLAAPWNRGSSVLFCAILLGLPFSFRRKRALTLLPLLLAAICTTGLLAGCGSSNPQPTPHTQAARTYIITATPTGAVTPAGSATVTNPTPVTITVTVQ